MGSGIAKLFQGYIRTIRYDVGTNAGPPTQKGWLIIGGVLNHATGTASELNILDKSGQWTIERLVSYAAGLASGIYPIFNQAETTTNVVLGSLWTMNLLTNDEIVHMDGGAGGGGYLKVIEFDLT